MRTLLRRRSISDFSYTPLAAALASALVPQVAQAANSIVVDNPSDLSYYKDTVNGNGTTLRGAIGFLNTAGNCSGSDTITFVHPNGNTPFVISSSSELDISCGGLTIDGGGTKTNSLTTLQPMYGGLCCYALWAGTGSNNVLVKGMEISGWTNVTGLGGSISADDNIIHSNGTGIYVSYGGATSITNNAIYNNQYDGIDIYGTTATITGNNIGLDASGNWAGNGYDGIYGYSNTLTIDGNTISANTDYAIDLYLDSNSKITGNKIGTDPTGNNNFGNDTGVYLYQATGTTINNGNVISNNYGGGIYIGNGSSGITIDGNKIGTDPSGNNDLSNYDGITAYCASDIQITNNSIASYSRSRGYGILFGGITGGGTMDIVNNAINVAGDGITALGGSSYGVILESDNCASSLAIPGKRKVASKAVRTKAAIVGATTGVMISGNNISNATSDGILISGANLTTITGNTIRNNGGYGVDIFQGTQNEIIDNPKIFGNGNSTSFAKGINLDFPTGVYSSGPDLSHANNGMNPPSISSAVVNYSTAQTTVAFTLTASPGTYKVQMCDNPVGTSAPGCNNIVANTTVTVPTSGTGSGSVLFFGVNSDNFSGTATSDATSDTSEFSTVFSITPAPNVTYVPGTTMDFGNVAVNGNSPPISINLNSSGATPYHISNLGSPNCSGGLGSLCTYGGAFTCTTTCVPTAVTPTSAYNPGSSCNFTAVFHPTALTSYSETIGICDDSPSYGGTITLTGTGVTPPPVAFQPASFDFGQVSVGGSSAPQTFTVFNGGTSLALLGEPSVDDANFKVVSNACGSSLAANTGCGVVVDFVPQGGGTYHSTLSIPAGGSLGSLQVKRAHGKAAVSIAGPGTGATASLTGTGVAQGAITLPGSLDLGTWSIGTPPNAQIVSFVNTGNAPVTFNTVSVSGEFSIDNGCFAALAPAASCSITVTYSAPEIGDHTGSLTVVTSAPGGSGAIKLTGKTVPSPVPILTVSPSQIGFGDRLLGSTSGTQRITITNVGNASATLSESMANTDFVIVFTSCTATLAPASSCYADVALRPVGFGPRPGAFIVNSNTAASPQGVGLSGSGCRPYSTSSSRLGSSFGCSP
jgi:hypothetical protein